jgi:hypothetical protein
MMPRSAHSDKIITVLTRYLNQYINQYLNQYINQCTT